MEPIKLIERCIYDTPLALTSLPDNLKDIANSLIPYDTGIEIECSPIENNYSLIRKELEEISPLIKDIDINGHEQRFRIPPGIDGMLCLYNISVIARKYFGINNKSGIHYHTDLTDIYDQGLITSSLLISVKDYLLSELDTWEYKGTYNNRNVSFFRCWVRFEKEKKTMEVRIGEMTFDYSLLVKRILHCQYLNKYVRASALGAECKLDYYQQKLKELNKVRGLDIEEVKQVVNNRVIRI